MTENDNSSEKVRPEHLANHVADCRSYYDQLQSALDCALSAKTGEPVDAMWLTTNGLLAEVAEKISELENENWTDVRKMLDKLVDKVENLSYALVKTLCRTYPGESDDAMSKLAQGALLGVNTLIAEAYKTIDRKSGRE